MGLLDNLLKSIVNNPGSGATPTTVTPVQQSVAAQEAAKPAAKAAGQSTETNPVKVLRGVTKKTPAQTATTPAQTQTPAQKAAQKPVVLPTGAVVTPAQSSAQRVAARTPVSTPEATKPKASETAAKITTESLKGQEPSHIYDSVAQLTGVKSTHTKFRVPTESVRRNGESLATVYYQTVKPAYEAYQKAEQEFLSGKISYGDYKAALDDYKDAYNRYQPSQEAWDKISYMDNETYWNDADLDELASTLSLYNTALTEGQTQIASLGERYTTAQQAYTTSVDTLKHRQTEYEAAVKALKTAEKAYKRGGKGAEAQYQKTWDAYETARAAYTDSYDAYVTAGHSLSELEGQYNAQMLYLTEIAGISNYGSETYQKRFLEANPWIIYTQEQGGTYGDPISVKTQLQKLQEGGSVDLLNRPEVDTSELKKAGWTDAGEGTATVFSSTFSNHDFMRPGEAKQNDLHAANFTPIVVDEEGNVTRILSPQELQEYARGVLLEGKDDELGLQIGGLFTGADALDRADQTAEDIHKLHEIMITGNYSNDMVVNHLSWRGLYDQIEGWRAEYAAATDEKTRKELSDKIQLFTGIMEDGKAYADMSRSDLQSNIAYLQSKIDTAKEELAELEWLDDYDLIIATGGEPTVPEGHSYAEDSARRQELMSQQSDAMDWLQKLKTQDYITTYEAEDGVLSTLSPETRKLIDDYIVAGGQVENVSSGSQFVDHTINAPQITNGVIVPGTNPTTDEKLSAENAIRDALASEGRSDKQIADIMGYVTRRANETRTKAITAELAEQSENTSTVWNFLAQRALNLAGWEGAVSNAAQGIFGPGGRDEYYGDWAPTDYYNDANLATHASRAVGQGEYQRILAGITELYGDDTDEAVARRDAQILNNIYNLFGSMADSTITGMMGATGTDLGLFLMSGNAATNTMIEMHEQGYSDGAVLTAGIVAAFAEFYTEKVEMDHLLGIMNRSSTTGLSFADVAKVLHKNAFMQGLSEMSEEVVSTLTNTLYDESIGRLANGGLTQIKYAAVEYQRQNPGATWEDAVKAAWVDWWKGLGEDALGGFASGYLMGGGAQVAGAVSGGQNRAVGRQVMQGDRINPHSDNSYALYKLASELDNELAKRAARLDTSVGADSPIHVGRMLNGFMDARVLDAVDTRLQQLGESDISEDLLRGINAMANGDFLTSGERKAVRQSEHGRQVARELQQVRGEINSAAEQKREANLADMESWATEVEQSNDWLYQTLTQSDIGAALNSQGANEIENRWAEQQKNNPNATVLTPIADQITEAGGDAKVAIKQGQLMAKILSGEFLTNKEMRSFDLNNPAVRKVFVERTGLTGIPDGHLSDGLKRTYANQISQESRLVRQRQESLRDGSEMLMELAREKSAGRANSLKEAAQNRKRVPFLDIFDAQARKANNARRNEEAQSRFEASAASRFTPGMTENQVIAQILQQTGVEIVSRAQYIASALREFGVDSYDQLSSSQKAAVETMYTQYLRGQGLSEDAVRALENAQAGRTKTARAGELIFEDSVDQSKIFGKDGEYDTRDIRGASIAVLDRMAKTLGLKIYLYESQNIGGTQKAVSDEGMILSDNGWFDPRDNSIHLDINAGQDGQGVILFTAAHELTHLIKRGSEEQFETFKQFLFDQYRHYYGGATLEQLINNQIQKAKAQGRTIDRATAEEEVVADSCERMLTDGNVVQTLESLRAADQSLFEKIVNFLRDLFDKITGMYADMDPDSAEGKMTAEMVGAFDELQYLWTEALDTATQRLNEMAPKDIDGEPGTPQFSMRSYAQGAGFELRMNEEGKPEIYDRNGKRVEKVTASMVVDSPLGKLVQDAVRLQGLSRADAQKQYQFIADLTNMIIQYRDAAVVWETAGSVMFSAIKANSDTQYSRTIDFSTICKKTQQIINVMSGAMKELGHGLSRVDVEAAYEEIHKAGEQVPCPVCYVFSHWMGIGNILDDINRFQNKYWTASEVDLQRLMTRVEQDAIRFAKEAVKKNPGKKDTYIWDKDGIQDGVRHKEGDVKIGRAISDLKSALGRSNMLAAQNTLNAIIDNKLRLRELEDPSFTTENLTPELAAQLARGNEEAAARLRMKILESVLSKQELKKLGNTALTAEDLKKYDSRIEAKLRELEAEIDRIKNQLEPYEAYQFLNGTIMLQAEDGSWSKNENYNNGNGPIPSEILFDLNAGHEFAAQYPDTWRYRTTRGNNAGKAMLPYSDTRVGEIITGIGSGLDKIENLDQTLNPFLYEDNEEDQTKREGILQSAIENQRRQNLIGGMRYQSTSDFRHQFGSDYLMSFFEMQAIGANVQLYTKVIEAVDFLASMGADCNLSVMPLNDGYIVDENGNRKLVYSSVTGMNGEAAIQMAHKYDNVQPILVGISDAHIRLALHGTDITFVIPFHGSGNTTAQIQTLMGAVRETLSIGDTGAAELTYDEGKARDYTATQSDKHLPEKETTAQQKALWKLRLDIIQGKAVPVTQKVGKKTVAREYFSFEEAFNELSPEQQETLNKSEYLRDLFERFYVKGVDSRTYQCFLAFDQAKQIFPYEYWDRNSTYTVERLPDELRERYSKYLDPNTEYDMADVNGFRFQEYCESMGIIPRFSGVENKKTGVVFGNFTKDSGYWKLLIDRAMFANRYDAKGNWIGYGKYRDQQKINVTKFKAETLDPKWADSNYGDVMVPDTDVSKTGDIVNKVVSRVREGEAILRGDSQVMHSARGVRAQDADLDELKRAEEMEKAGTDWNSIRRETGWYRGADGLWRSEIDDSKAEYHRDGDARFAHDHPEYAEYLRLRDSFALEDDELDRMYELEDRLAPELEKLKQQMRTGPITLDMILQHDELFNAYPELRDMQVKFQKMPAGENAYYDPQNRTITINRRLQSDPIDTLLHEIQHAIQDIEGFTGGSSTEYWTGRGYSGKDAMRNYRGNAGEIEARDVANRRRLTAEERRNTPPDRGVPRGEEILHSGRTTTDFFPVNSYTEDPGYQATLARSRELWRQRDENRARRNEIDTELRSESAPKPRAEWTDTDELDSLLGRRPVILTERGEQLTEERKKLWSEYSKIEEAESKVDAELLRVKKAAHNEQIRKYTPVQFRPAQQTSYPGFTLEESGNSYATDILERGLGDVVEMSPREYLECCAYEIFDGATLESTIYGIDFANAQEYAQNMLDGDQFPLPYLDYKTHNQEGRHRAMAAYLAGIDQIPVLIIGNYQRTQARDSGDLLHSARATVAPVQQNITSAATSINANKIPVLYTNNNVKFIPNGVNVDIGGGRFDNVTELLGSMGVTNLIFDPYNRSEKHNSTVLAFLTSGQRADTVTCSNCLNVIAEPDARANVILECAKALKPDGVAYFTVYEGDGTGKSRATKSGWQENRKTATYADEIREYFDNVQVKGKVIIAQEAKADLPQATWETTPGTAYRYSSRDVQNTNAAATQLDDLMGKGTARNLQALARKYEQRAEAAQKQLELERAQRKIQERQFKKELLEAKKAKGQIEKASSKALRATNNELNKTRREMQQRETALKKKMSDMATDTVWKVGIAQSNGEQRLNEQRRFYKDKLGYTEQQLKEQKKATRTAEKAGMDLALEAERQGKRDTEAALRLAEEAKREGDRRVREAEKAGMDLAMEEHRNAEKNYKYGQKWARGLQRSAVENTRKEERSVAKSKEGLLRKVLSIPGRAAVSERTRFRNKANRVMMNQETAPATPIFQNEQDSKIPKSAAEFGKLARDGYDKFYRAMVNDVAELDRLAKLQTRTDNLSVQVNIVRASSATLESLYHVGLVDKAGNVVGGSMEDVFLCHDADGKFDEKLQKSLQEYMYNKHNVDRMSLERKAIQRVQDFLAQPNRQWLAELTNTELAQLAAEGNDIAREYVQLLHWANNVRNKAVLPGADNYAMTADESQQIVDLYENDPEMKWVVDKANAIYEWWDQFMRTWAVGTSISEADYLDMREMYPHYVPTYRVDEGGHAASVRANATGLSVGEVTKAAKGSTRQLLNIEDQFVRSAQSIIKNARRNDLVRTLVEELLFDDEGVFEQFGVYDWDNADPATKQTFWDFDDEQDKSSMEKVSIDGKDAYHISCWVDGVKMSAYVNRAMFEGLSSLFNRNENKTAATLGHIGSKITQPMKNMITGYNPTFAIKNIFRDQHTALTNSNNGIAYWRYLGEAAAKIATNDSDWINFQALGGVSAELTRVEGGFAKAVAPVKGVAKVKKGLKTFFGTPGEISESLSRFAEYLGTIDRLGGDTYENRMAAIRDAAEVTVDFGRHGSIGRYINMWVPYWNANVQGLDKMIRNIAQQPDVKSVLARTSRAVLVNLIPAALQAAIIAACGKWKEYEELSDQQKDNYYCIPVGKSGHKFLKFPKSQDWAAFISTPFLRIMEGVNGRDDPMEGWFESAVMPNMPFDTRTVLGVENVPVLLPFGADWVLDLAENKNYAGSAIIPYNLQDASAKEQFDADTSLLAYYFGKVFEGSPMALDYMIDNYFGNFWGIAAKTLPISPLVSRGIVNGETKFLDRLIDAGTTVISPFISDNRYSSATMSAYYDMIGELEQEVTDAGAHGDKKDAEHYAIYEALNQSGGYVDQIRALAAQARDIPKGDDQAAIRMAEIGLMQEAMDFVEKTLDGEIKDPKLWMTYHGYGDRIMAEAEALRKYDGEFNFSGALGKPTVIYDRSGATDIKYNLKDNAEAQQEYARLRAEEYQKALNTVISDSKYKSLSPTEKAARLEEAKRIGLKKADQRMLQYLKDEGIKGESVGKTDYSTEERAAAYSVSWLLGENGAYKPALTDAFLDLYDYNDQYSFIPADSARKTFKDQSDNSKVYTLTTAQQKKYADMYHDMITKYYDTVMASPEYKAAGRELRAAMLARAKTYANDDIKEQFDAWLKQTGATSVAQEKASGEISLEAKYAIQRALGDDHAMKQEVTDELVRLYQYSDVGEVEFFPITTAPKQYVDDRDKSKSYVWILDDDQREVYMSMMFDIYQRNVLEVMQSSAYKSADDYGKAQLLCDVRSRLSGEVQSEFKHWLRTTGAERTFRNSPEAQAQAADVAAAGKIVDGILGTARTYKQFNKARGY